MKTLLGTVLFAAVATTATAQQANPPKPADRKEMAAGSGIKGSDNSWITKVAQGGLAEVELGKLAQERGSSDAVKQFGKRMVDDHSTANEELSQLAQSKGVTVPSSLDAKSQALKDKLSKLDGTAFDKAYMSEMVKDHKMDVAEFQKEANSGHDAEAKAFAAKTLPTLQEHLRVAEETAAGAKK